MTWEFITKPVHSPHAASWEWAWRCKNDDGSETTSARTFPGFKECIADARRHGFTGDPDPGESGTLFKRPEARFTWW